MLWSLGNHLFFNSILIMLFEYFISFTVLCVIQVGTPT